MLIIVFPVRRVTPIVPALALAKVIRSEAFVPTRWRSSRVPRAVESVAASGMPPRDTAVATRPQREGTAVAAAAVVSESPALVPAAGDQAVVNVADDDAPSPRWGQWENQPASAPERAPGVLVMREDDCVMS
jgi:hypothetical protein